MLISDPNGTIGEGEEVPEEAEQSLEYHLFVKREAKAYQER
jgi:hypothetical protein